MSLSNMLSHVTACGFVKIALLNDTITRIPANSEQVRDRLCLAELLIMLLYLCTDAKMRL